MSHDLLFEIGAEEIPPSYVAPALEQLERGVRAGLAELRLGCGDIRTYGAPRRLALAVSGLETRQPDRDEEVTGPSAKAAFDANGQPTRALLGFCQGRGIDPAAVRRVSTPKGEYVAATVHHAGRPAADVLPDLLARLATSLQFPKSMRWLSDDTRFARPVRWLVALLDDRVLPVHAFELEAGRESFGHRFLARGPVGIPHAREYAKALQGVHVMVDPEARRQRIETEAQRLAKETGGILRADDELVDINTFMTEHPTVFVGRFDRRYLDLPNEVIISALREHQKFFAVQALGEAQGDAFLADAFVAVRDGDDRGLDVVRRGNEIVLTARLEDAEFYWNTDRKRSLEQQTESLKSVVWMEGLGSLYEKAQRLESLAAWLAARLAPGEEAAVRRAALLCKTDLTSEMIGSGKEYAALQGVIGAYYAKDAGEPEPVSRAIYEHYRPAAVGDALPESAAGAILSLADKLDHVGGLFVGGRVPKGSEDPYGVRRAGNGVLRVLLGREWNLDLYAASMESTRILMGADPDLPHAEIMRKLGEFWRGRIETALEERGMVYDARDAALEARPFMEGRPRPGWIDPLDALRRAEVLAAFRTDARFEPLVILFKRVANILRAATEPLPGAVDRGLLRDTEEQALAAALDTAQKATTPLWERRDYRAIIPALLEMERPIHSFFDHVLVNAEDEKLRLNRLQLLSDVRALFLRGWDLSRVVVEGEKAAPSQAVAAAGR